MTALPKLTSTERAMRELLAEKVAEGLIAHRAARTILSAALPMATKAIAEARRAGSSEQWITRTFQTRVDASRQRLAAAKSAAARQSAQLALLSAELYVAAWTGMREDLARFVAETDEP